MPSVGMRRSTRVFGARVLRSGRRLWPHKNSNGEWIELLDNSRDGGGDATSKRKERARHLNDVSEQEAAGMDIDVRVVVSISEPVVPEVIVANDRRWGIVYTRKRKKVDPNIDSLSAGNTKRFGKQFFRKKLRKQVTGKELPEACDSNVGRVTTEGSFENSKLWSLMVVVDTSFCCWDIVSCFLGSILRYMWIARGDLLQISAFINSETIALTYASCGIRFLQESELVQRGACTIWDADTSTPMFSVDYSAVPYCFMYLNSRRQLDFDRLSCSLERHSVDIVEEDDEMTISGMPSEAVVDLVTVPVFDDDSMKIEVVSLNSSVSNARRSVPRKSGHHIQTRSSFRSKRGRPSALGTRKASGSSPSRIISYRHHGTQVSPMTQRHGLRSSARKIAAGPRNIVTNIKQVKSVSEGLKPEVDLTKCSANVLVTDSEKCYRVEGAMISLETFAEKQWNLVIKKDGMDPYRLVAQKFMRPCSCNRFTHAVMWNTDNDWKLEFPDRQDWLIFKELYKRCSDRNVQDPAESFIPVPGVCEVSGYVNSSSVFLRPDSYISLKDDELSRAFARTANYDMDSEDEEWLNKFNGESGEGNLDHELLSADDFELAIDAFEKGSHSNPDEFSDECKTPEINLGLERRVLDAVYRFWIKKRKQRRGALVKVFQLYQRRRTQLIPDIVLRKKRSFKRQGGSSGRGKQRPLLQAMAAEQDALEQQKVEEATAAANRSEELAVLKRQRAQQLMEAADLATYKATMALKIAEMAQNARSPDNTVDLLL